MPQHKDTKSCTVMDKDCKYICIKHLVDGLNKICNLGRSKLFFCLVHKVQIKPISPRGLSYLILGSKIWIRAKKHQQQQ